MTREMRLTPDEWRDPAIRTALLQTLMEYMTDKLPRGYAAVMVVAGLGENPDTAYVAGSRREDAAKLLRETAAAIELQEGMVDHRYLDQFKPLDGTEVPDEY